MVTHAPRPYPILERDRRCAYQHRAHVVRLYFWLRVFLSWEVGKMLHSLCQVPLTEPHDWHESENERWKSGVYDGFYCSFKSVRGIG